MLRNILAVFIGIASGIAVVALVEILGHTVYAAYGAIEPGNPEAIAAALKILPLGALIFVVVAWALGAASGSMVATLVSGRQTIVPGMAVGFSILLATIGNLYIIAHPAWMTATGIIAPLPAAWLGATLVRK